MKLTPVMQQYVDIKRDHEDSLLFFRLGDFYEMFFEDRITRRGPISPGCWTPASKSRFASKWIYRNAASLAAKLRA